MLFHRKPKADKIGQTYEKVMHIALDVLIMLSKNRPGDLDSTLRLARNFKHDMLDLRKGKCKQEIIKAIDEAWIHHMQHMVLKANKENQT